MSKKDERYGSVTQERDEIKMSERVSNKKVLSNFTWRLFERISAKGVAFIISILLARLLDPSVYGTIAMTTVFINILQVFVNSGMGNALIQKKNVDQLDFSSVFYFNIISCSVLYLIVFFSAPFIADFYGDFELTPIIRVLGLALLVSGIKNIQQAYVSKHLLFKKFFFATLAGTIGAGIIGIVFAYKGFGVWALVAQHLFNLIIDTIILWVTVKWRPSLAFSGSRLKILFSYGWKLLATVVLNDIYTEFKQLIIGKMYSSENLAYYNKGYTFPHLIVVVTNNSMNSVLFPVMSKAQDDLEQLKRMTSRTIKTSTYVMMPIMMGLAVCAEPLVRFLLTEKWLPCVPFLRIFCFICAFWGVNTANQNAIKAMGRSDLTLKIGIVKTVADVIILLISMWFGPLAIAIGWGVSNILEQILVSWMSRKLLGYSFEHQCKDILPNAIITLLMGACVYLVSYLHFSDGIILCLQVISGIVVYLLASSISRNDSFLYLIQLVKTYQRKRK